METITQAVDLTTENAALKAENAELKRQIDWLMAQLKLKCKRQFGASSEKSAYDYAQITLFNEAEYFADPCAAEPKLRVIKEHYRKTRLVTDKLPPELPVETVEAIIPESERVCPECHSPLHCIGKETVREELKIIPAKAVLVAHVRNTYGCRKCALEAESATIVKAKIPEPVIKGGFASPESVAHLMVQKFVMGLPLYRQEREFARQRIMLSRQTMCNWIIKAAYDWLTPIYELLHSKLCERELLLADETEFQVLHEPGRTARQKSYLWVYRTGNDGLSPIALSDYQTGRGSEHPKAFLRSFKGYLHTDGWEPYRKLPDVTIVGCWAHARRLYDQALKVLPEKEREGTNALRGKRYCDELFAIERELAELSANERYLRRLALAKPLLEDYHAWLMSFKEIGKTLFGKAVSYSLNQWRYLQNYLLDGRLEMSNNRTERTIKRFVIDRKNFLFANTPRGARASAVIFSIIETAIENGLDPYEYLVNVFTNAPNWSLDSKSDWAERLLPFIVSDSS